jgi:hypothetical protein
MITINRKNPTEGEVTSSLTSEAGGLHFDGAAGYVTCGDSTILDGATKLSIEVIIQTTSTTEGRILAKQFDAIAYALRNDAAGTLTASIGNGSSNVNVSTSGTYNDGKPHHVVVTWDNATIKIYVDGTQDGSGTLAGGSIQNTSDFLELGARAKSGSRNSFFNGVISRARLHNRVIDAKVAFENQNIDFSEQWGSQTDLVTNGAFTGGTTNWGLTSVTYGTNNVVWAAAGGWAYIRQASWDITAGKKYRITYDISGHSANGVLQLWDYGGANTIATLPEITGNGTFTHEFEALKSSSSGVILGKVGNTFVGTMDNVSCVAIGAVSSFELQAANPTQSLMVQDSSGAADGTCSASGITQINGITQVNAVSGRFGTSQKTVADGEVIANVLKAASDSSHATVELDAGSNSSNSDTNFSLSGTRKGIIRYDHNASDASGKFQFFSGGNTSTARVVLDGAGLVGVNQGAPVQQMQVTGDGSGSTAIDSHGYGLRVSDSNHAHGAVDIVSSADTAQFIARSNVQGGFSFKSYGSAASSLVERLKIDVNGQLTLGVDADPSQTATPSMLVTAATAPSAVNGYSQLVLQRSDGNTGDGAQIMFNQGYHSGNTDYPAPVGAIRGYRTGPDAAYGGGVKLLYQPDSGALGVKPAITLSGAGNFGIGVGSDIGGSGVDSFNAAERMEMRAAGAESPQFLASCYSATSSRCASLAFKKSHTNTGGVLEATLDGENLGKILWKGVSSGDGERDSASIEAVCHGAPDGSDQPAKLVFKTSATDETLGERMIIDRNGVIEAYGHSGGYASIRGENSITLANDASTTFEAYGSIFAIYQTDGQGALFFNEYQSATVEKLAGSTQFVAGTASGNIRVWTGANDATVNVRNYSGSNATIKIITFGM